MPVFDIERTAPDPSESWDFARGQLRLMTNATAAPEIDDRQLDVLLEQAAVTDAAGERPSSERWTPTFDLDRAAAAGWRQKAAALADHFNIQVDGHKFDRAQAYAQAMQQADMYEGRSPSKVGM